jgi:hypothetical protein
METPPKENNTSNGIRRTEDEYTDYSCSTSIERLARDVETLLRGWHVDKGNDRHISMTRNNTSSNTSTTATAPTKNNGHPYASSNSSVTSQISNATTTTNITTPQTLLLRSDTLLWNVSLTNPTGHLVSFTVELQLSLWDGPSASENNNNHHHDDNATISMMEGLPHSLRRSSHLVQPMAAAVFENMSHLFGIGQHITLTPTKKSHHHHHHHPNHKNQQPSVYDNVQVGGDLQFFVQSILVRHEDEILARYSLFQILSGWLQTALNCAVANCHCCIPIFGFWGSYQPDWFFQQQQQQQGNNHGNYQTTTRRQRNSLQDDHQQQQQLLSVFPSWMQDVLCLELPGLPRMTRQRYMETQDQQNRQFLPPILMARVLPTIHTFGQFGCSVIPCACASSSRSTTPSRLTFWSNLLLQHCPNPQKDAVVLTTARHVYAWQKQPLVKATAFQMLFQPDNYHYESEHNPYTAWRRKPALDNATTIRTSSSPRHPQQQQEQIIDLTTGDNDDDDDDTSLPYHWGQQSQSQHHDSDSAMQLYSQQLERYQDDCRKLAVSLLDQAAGSTAAEPRWGSVDDPVAAVHATVTWNGSPQPQGSTSQQEGLTQENNPDHSNESQNQAAETNSLLPKVPRQPLLSFPLRIRSEHTMSNEDWMEMEESVERTILDPLAGVQSCQFQVQVWWDLETPVASLSAAQQCILAALIRTSTLPDETLLKHLTDDAVLAQWDYESGNVVAACLAEQAQVGSSTKAIVAAMDWRTVAEEKMALRDAEVLVRHILQPDNGSNFPHPPTSPLPTASGHSTSPPATRRRRGSLVGAATTLEASPPSSSSPNPNRSSTDNSNLFAPLFKSAPIGRLVNILCVHLARVRSPCSMAMLWMAFCHEVRVRWEHRVALPHINHYVPGLDPSPLEMKERNRCLTALGVKADHAAYWHCTSLSESASVVVQPDTEFPGDHHCLVGQKLQVRWTTYESGDVLVLFGLAA